jgi:hypothetical protein
MRELQSRRRVLIARCELQRAEMALRVGELRNDPVRRVLVQALGGTLGGSVRPFKHPLTWAVAIAGLLFLRRPRQVLTMLMWARSAVAVASKAGVALKVFGQLRSGFARRRGREPA